MEQSWARQWRPSWPCPAHDILAQQRHGRGDPTYASEPGVSWRAFSTPLGPGVLRVTTKERDGVVSALAWGAGAEWLLESLPALLGDQDDASTFVPNHRVLEQAWRSHAHHRFGRSGLVLDSLVPAVIEQKVTTREAFASYRALVRRHGSRAPGPMDGPELWVPPDAGVLALIPSWEWLDLRIDPARSRTLVTLARTGASLERLVDAQRDVDSALRSLPGVGRWTSAEVRQRSFGDPDAVSLGDYHLAKDVGWALAGRAMNDEEVEEFLRPWAGHRGRVVALVRLAGLRRPRRGPRMTPRTHLPGGSRGGVRGGR